MKSIILAGGKGSTLWPLSREKYPKQFLKIKEFSLFQQAFKRSLKVSNISEIFIVTNEDLKFYVMGQIEELGYQFSWSQIVIEPVSKNTLAAICLGVSAVIKRFDKECTVCVFPSDHSVSEEVIKSIVDAESYSKNGYLVTFGVLPASANTNYGYIKAEDELGQARKVVEFIEKPSKHQAKKLVENKYYWNSGIFVFQPMTLIDEIKTYAPDFTFLIHQRDTDESKTTGEHDSFENLDSVSIDVAILEQSKKVVMVPLNCHWNDIDDFSDLYHELDKDEKGNVTVSGELLTAASKNDLVSASTDKLISLINLDDMIVVDTDDVLFIAPKKDSKHVKEIVSFLKEKKDKRIINGLTVYRPWGFYKILEATKHRVIKKIRVFPKHAISLQLHHHRSEHWVVVNGKALVYIDGKENLVKQGESTFIKPDQKHRLTNPSETEPLEIIEVQLGEIVTEEDIVRFEDMYGRN